MAASSAATSGVTTIRVRLHFDYPPPAVADCRMCWVLVDLHRCRVVADLESVIRDRFHFGRKSLLSLFVEDCYLPHTESILVVRDNDTVRVKVDTLAQVNGCSSHPGTPKDKSSKRARCTEDDGSPTENGESVKKKDKKKKKKEKVGEEAMEAESKVPGDNDAQTKKKHKKNKKKTKMAEPEKTVTNATPKPATSKPHPAAAASQPAKSTASASVNTKGKTQRVSSSDSSDSSEEDEAPKKTPSQKAAPKTTSSTPTLPKPPPKAAPSVSSSETDSSSCDEAPKKAALKNAKPVPSSTALNGATGDKNTSCKPLPGSSSSQPAHSSPTQRAGNVSKKAESADSSDSSEEEIKLVIKRPNAGLGFGLGPDAVGGPSPSARGRGRGNVRGVCGAVERGRGGGRDGIRTRGGGRGAGRVRGHVNFGFNYNDQQQQQPSYQTDSLTNESVVLQNPEESTPKRDYSTMPLLAAPPPVGESIAFKLLELTENYTPEVSEYKEGRIVSFDPITKQIQLDLLSASRGPVEPGKFDLVYTNADGTVDWSQLESAVTHSSQVAERWESLLEPRLIII